ncbi:unnamed protein product [Bursaphelenchus okinawaensis]|uniref:Uncharacterized protein n=1 Tax=Bursaphelenchus okinawaensis TaxID=465554 RepID=A0A811KH03_9BILA|nr:unnamed protein product [Bursaphelenchus okinawaensis]CAG9102964.1 unnamed protein product [Bursaphelenchus okinawaensis]
MNGFTVDDMNMLRIGDPDVTEVSVTLNELCEQFTANVGTLSEHLTAIQEIFKQIGELADREKIVVMNAQNELKMVQTNQNNSKDVMKVQGKVQEKQWN